MTLITWQYFFMLLKSFSNCFLPSSSCHFLQYLVKAFFLDLCLQEQSRDKVWLSPSSIPQGSGDERKELPPQLVSAHCQLLRTLFHWQAEPGAHQTVAKLPELSGAANEFQSTLIFTVQKTKDCREMSNNNRKNRSLKQLSDDYLLSVSENHHSPAL